MVLTELLERDMKRKLRRMKKKHDHTEQKVQWSSGQEHTVPCASTRTTTQTLLTYEK
jgi:hypothetical protein